MNNIVNTLAKAISVAVIAVVARDMTRAIELDWRKTASPAPADYGYPNDDYPDYEPDYYN